MEELEKEYAKEIEFHNTGKLINTSAPAALSDEEELVRTDDQLWVEKYTSHRFFDLLTEEVTNRNVMTWMKSWDELVFPERSKVNLKMPDSLVSSQHDIKFKK